MDLIEDSIEDYKNKHEGERVFIVGNGPSLKDTPLHLLKNEYSTAMNRIDLIYEDTSWRPTYYFQLNSFPRPQQDVDSANKHVELGLPCFFSKQLEEYFEKEKNMFYIDGRATNNTLLYDQVMKKRHDIWSNDITDYVYKQSSTLYAVVQIVSYMGFEEIYFVGTDLYPIFKPAQLLPRKLLSRGQHTREFIESSGYGGEKNYKNFIKFARNSDNSGSTLINGLWFKLRKDIISNLENIYKQLGKIDDTHFSPEYRDYKYYDEFKNERLIDIHKTIRQIGYYEGFDCYNATVGGNLEVHERVDLKSVI